MNVVYMYVYIYYHLFERGCKKRARKNYILRKGSTKAFSFWWHNIVYVCQQVVDCRICGDPTSDDGLRFGFVELQHEG